MQVIETMGSGNVDGGGEIQYCAKFCSRVHLGKGRGLRAFIRFSKVSLALKLENPRVRQLPSLSAALNQAMMSL